MRIEVAGIPAPQGSKRHVGGGRMVESSRAVGPWREAVRDETQRAVEAGDWFVPGQPVQVEMTFYLPRPKGHYGTGRNAHLVKPSAPHFPSTRPDVDKLIRSSLDGIVEGGAIDDDSQVCDLWAAKRFADKRRPGCLIFVEEMRLGDD